MLGFQQLALRRGNKLLFSDMDLVVHRGAKAGLIGANGCGKSSLFSLILGELQADQGEFTLPGNLSIAHVAQETPAVDDAALDYVMAGDAELVRLREELRQAEQRDEGVRQAELHVELDNIGGYSAEARAAQLMQGLGFGQEALGRAVRTFSGGWRVRLNLARTLMCRSDLLLLDEPTNHLDLDAVIWLEAWLRAYPGTLLLISHDRDFLDSVCDQMLHMEQGRVTGYRGNYSAFERQRAERLAQQQSAFEKQQREIAHIHKYVERFRAKASKARQAQSRLKTLARMELIAPAHVDSPFHFGFRPPLKAPNPLLRLEEAAAGYGGTPVLSGVGLTISPGDRIGLLGANGAGKSTLIKLLAGELQPLTGRRECAQDLKLAYFAQHQLEQLDPEASPLQHLQRLDRRVSEQELRNFLGGFGFVGEMATAPVAPFSGGEKSRVVLALLVWQRPNLILLDEPTNHLDLEMRHALGEALLGFDGAVVLVSHDRHLLDLTADSLLLVSGGQVTEFDRGLDEYPRWLMENRRGPTAAVTPVKSDGPADAGARKDRRRVEAEQRRQLQPLRNRLKKLESEMETLQRQRTELQQLLADPAIYEPHHKHRLLKLLADQQQLDARHEACESDWLEVSESLEQAASLG